MPSNLVELAKKGDPQAIATLITQQLQPHGITVEVNRRDSCLYILLASLNVPKQERSLQLIRHTLEDLDGCILTIAKVCGYRLNQSSPAWSAMIEIGVCNLEQAPLQQLQQLQQSDAAIANLEPVNSLPAVTDRFIVCGLGSLGQYCVVNLKKFADREFNVHITAIDNFIPENWEIDGVVQLLSEALIVDDCRKESVLERAGIRQCRAILLVTSDESTNIEAAITARRLNPNVRLVVRSSRQNLYQLLKQQLGDFVVLDPTELPAAAFAWAGFGEGTLGFFNIGDRQLRVVEQEIQANDARFNNLPAYTLHKKTHLLLSFPANASDRSFFQWQPDVRVKVGDKIAYIEEVEDEKTGVDLSLQRQSRSRLRSLWQNIKTRIEGNFSQKMTPLWEWVQEQQARPIVAISLLIGLVLWIVSAVLLKFNVPNITWEKAITAGVILLLGGFGDIFGGLEEDPIPLWVKLICLLITGISILFLLGVLGLIADSLLTYRFESRTPRPRIPERNHVVLVGLGSVGKRVAALLQVFKQPMVVLADQVDDLNLLPQIPLITGDILKAIATTNLESAKSIVLVTKDQMLNLEIALISHAINPHLGLVIRTFDQYFDETLLTLLPQAKSFCAYALSAEAFAGAAFGENMLSLFCLNNRTILVAEYYITPGDTLIGKMLAQIAYGYGVVPIFLQTNMPRHGLSESIMPSDDEYLHQGDRLIVLASISGLRRIERGEITPPRLWRLYMQESNDFRYPRQEAEEKFARISGCDRQQTKNFFKKLPNTIELPLYDTQAYRLGHELSQWLTVRVFPA